MRRFERVEKWAAKYDEYDVPIPQRTTEHAAGYDFICPTDITIPANDQLMISTNIKAKLENDEALILIPRSNMGKKKLCLANGLGLIDPDYYGNPGNDGNLCFLIWNRNDFPFEFKKGDKIGQGFFIKYLVCDDDKALTNKRLGGFGSTGK